MVITVRRQGLDLLSAMQTFAPSPRPEAQYELLLAAPVAVAALQRDGRLMLINPALAETLGYEIAELHGRWLSELLSDGAGSQQREQVERLLTGELGSTRLECQLKRSDGRLITVILSVAAITAEPSREIGGILALQDISDRKCAEDALRASQQRLEQAEQVAATGTWDWDLVGQRISWSSGLFRIFMMEPCEVTWGFDEGISRHVFPDDRAPLREALARAITERSSVRLELRALRADGRVRVLEAQADVVVDDDGEPLRMIATVHDVTEARLAQQALQTASSDLADRARELQQLAAGSRASAEPAAPDAELSERQLEILQLVAQGFTNAQIAQRLYISETTVKWHIRQILVKTNASNRAEAVAHVLGVREL
jgi:PAS domain S-box-containing protein